jgi:SAM-dependent methyltransferase
MSFGSIAEDYDGLRPQPPCEAVDWLVPSGCEVAVDVGAGTGLFTRTLTDRAAQIVAVEPDARMRDVLAARSPGVRVVEGRGESIPLPGAAVVAMLGTYSRAIIASPDDRATALADARAALDARLPGADTIDVPMRAFCWRADRITRC